jgi:hypothetical protein
LRFLKLAAAKTSRSSKIENLLLLLLRCALFLVIILAAARPVILATAGHIFGTDVPRTVVLIVDDSLSMGYRVGDRTRLEAEKDSAQAILDSLKQGDRVAVIAANDRAEAVVAEPTIDKEVAKRAVGAIRVTPRPGNLAPALRDARKLVAAAERGVREIYVLTDGQAGGWRFDPQSVFDDAWKLADIRLVVVRPDDVNAANAAITRAIIHAPFLVPGAATHGVATVENFSEAPFHDVVQLQLAGSRVAQNPVDIPPGGSVEIPLDFQTPLLSGRWVKGEVKLSGDKLEPDDNYKLAIPIYQPPRVLIVEAQQIGPERLRSGFYLKKALTTNAEDTSGAVSEVRTISAQQLDETSIESYSAVFLADPGRLSERSCDRLERFLKSGGMVVFFPGDQTALEDIGRMDFLPAKVDKVVALEAGRQPMRLVDAVHPLFANVWDSSNPFPAMPEQKALELTTKRGSPTLAVMSDKYPFIVSQAYGAGTVFMVNASADRAWGDFPLTPAFLPLVQQFARMSVLQMGQRVQFSIGEPIPVPATMPLDKPVAVKYPVGGKWEVPARPSAVAITLPEAEQPGWYELTSRNGMEMLLAVNADRRESDLHAIDKASLLKMTPNEYIVGVDALKDWLAQSRGLVPLWPVLLLLGLGIFVAEAILSNVMARRRAQGAEQHIKTGRLNRRRSGNPFRVTEEEVQA